jgi:hypothetical protein
MLAVRKGLALAAILWCSSAHADDADAMIERGIQLREQGKDEEALGLFQRAFQTSPSPRAKAQIALAEQALGRWLSAEKDLGAALASASDGWIAKHKTALDGALATIQSHLGDLVLIGGVGGADVRVDGTKVATLPASAPVRLDVGTHTLEISAAGYYPISQPVTIRSDAPARVSLDMHARTADDPPPVTAHDPPPVTHRVDAPPPDTNTGKGQRIAGIVVAASAVVPLVIAFAGIGARGSEVGAYNSDPTCPGKEVAMKPAQCQSHIDAAGTWETVTIVGFVAAGVLAVAGGVILFTAPSGKTVASLHPSPNGLVLTF